MLTLATRAEAESLTFSSLSPVLDGGRFAAGVAGVLAGVGDGRAGTGDGFTSVGGVVPVFAFAGVRGVAVGLGVGVGVTGQSNRPLGVIVHPAGRSCMNGLWPGGIFIV
jgi:hypothetical protein